jgi:hypothetical protein
MARRWPSPAPSRTRSRLAPAELLRRSSTLLPARRSWPRTPAVASCSATASPEAGRRTPTSKRRQPPGAKGLIVVKDLPRRQIRGFYRPYRGIRWGVPGAYLGADEGQRIKDALDGGARVEGTLTVRATVKPASTRVLLSDVKRLLVRRGTTFANFGVLDEVYVDGDFGHHTRRSTARM